MCYSTLTDNCAKCKESTWQCRFFLRSGLSLIHPMLPMTPAFSICQHLIHLPCISPMKVRAMIALAKLVLGVISICRLYCGIEVSGCILWSGVRRHLLEEIIGGGSLLAVYQWGYLSFVYAWVYLFSLKKVVRPEPVGPVCVLRPWINKCYHKVIIVISSLFIKKINGIVLRIIILVKDG